MISQTVPVFPRDLKVSFWKIEYTPTCEKTLLPLPTGTSLSFGRWFHFIPEWRWEITTRLYLYVSSWIPKTETHSRTYISQQKPITFVLLTISDKIKYILYLNKIFGSKYSILLIGVAFSCGNGAEPIAINCTNMYTEL